MHLKAFSAIIKGCLEYCVIYRGMTKERDAEFYKAGYSYIHKFTHFIRVNMSKDDFQIMRCTQMLLNTKKVF